MLYIQYQWRAIRACKSCNACQTNFPKYKKVITYTSVVQLQARKTISQNLSLVDCKRRQPSIKRHGKLMGQNLGLIPFPSEGFF